ncbi:MULTISPECIES: divalent cation tolerance protein CutA [unclassified Nonomuraea]|uniref:divalent cation tolerance protein CutA n=1 Tax=unclassified Nonomuraea TaxID=2593643 RepID=UPI003401EE95
MTRHVEVRVTADSREEAERIVNAAVESRVAAGAQISGQIVSTYWWKGEIQTAPRERYLCLDDAQLHSPGRLIGVGLPVVATPSRPAPTPTACPRPKRATDPTAQATEPNRLISVV